MIRTTIALLLFLLPTFAPAEELKSGPAVGEKLPGAFHPLNVNGMDTGKKSCQVCKNGDNPVAMVFVQGEPTEQLVRLLKRLDTETRSHKLDKLGSFAVFCSDEEKLESRLRRISDKEQINSTVLTIDNPTGPKGYQLHRDAAVTVILYGQKYVVVNRAFRAGELDEKAINAILQDLDKLLKTKQ